jgi:hypothetical protein
MSKHSLHALFIITVYAFKVNCLPEPIFATNRDTDNEDNPDIDPPVLPLMYLIKRVNLAVV